MLYAFNPEEDLYRHGQSSHVYSIAWHNSRCYTERWVLLFRGKLDAEAMRRWTEWAKTCVSSQSPSHSGDADSSNASTWAGKQVLLSLSIAQGANSERSFSILRYVENRRRRGPSANWKSLWWWRLDRVSSCPLTLQRKAFFLMKKWLLWGEISNKWRHLGCNGGFNDVPWHEVMWLLLGSLLFTRL